MSELSSNALAKVARRWIDDYRRAPSIKQGWRIVRILERVLANLAEVERAAAEKAWDDGWNEGVDWEVNEQSIEQAGPNPYRLNEGEKQ